MDEYLAMRIRNHQRAVAARIERQYAATLELLALDHKTPLVVLTVGERKMPKAVVAENVRYVTYKEAVKIHALVTGIKHGVKSPDRLKAALAQPRQAGFGEEFYPTIAVKAVCLLYGIACGHPMHDGNKRLAWAVMAEFLRRNGLFVDLDPVDAASIVLALVTKALTTDQVVIIIDRALIRA